MGNTPSKNSHASPSTQNNSSLSAGSSTSTTVNGSSEPEPDDRKFPSSYNANKLDIKKKNDIKLATLNNGGGSSANNHGTPKYKQKLQEKVPATTVSHFHYFNENDSDYDLEIAASMAKALKIESSNGQRSRRSSHATEKDELASSFNDVFTLNNPSSSSSSLCISPENLPKILGNKKSKRKLDIDIDSIIERLLTSSGNSTLFNSNPDPLLPSTSPNSVHSSASSNNGEFFITPKEIQILCSKAREIFLSQPSLLRLSAPVKVVGDIHGQFNDLLRVLKLSGLPPHSNYLFLGDYVDRGKQSLETILLLLCYKIKYPENFFMLRGNHESANISKIYGFYDECKRRLNLKCWKYFIDVFNTLPLAAVINDKIFCVHGGLSPSLRSMDQITNIQRPTDIPEEGLLADLLWSDPDHKATEWETSDRGVSYVFGSKVVESFAKKFKFDLVIRGHMVVEDGYEFFAKKKLVTIFSAPNYCGEFNNWGAVMCVDSKLMCSFELLKPNRRLIHHGSR